MKSQRWYEDNPRPQSNELELNKIISDLHQENTLLRQENWRLREEIIRLNTELAKYRII